jgi:hypothetical protein
MSIRLAVAAVAAALSLIGCGPSVPTTSPAPSPTGTQVASASAGPSALPDGSLPFDDPAYLVGEAFSLPVGDAGGEWTAPSVAPVMLNGRAAARVAFLPASCATGNFSIVADAPADDPWAMSLQADSNARHYEAGSWPAAQVPECSDGHGRTYLEVGYRPFAPLGTIHLALSSDNATNAPTSVRVVPVFTSADATQPSLTMVGSTALEPTAGPVKPRSPKAKAVSAVDVSRTTLPDGSAPTEWGLVVTGCGPVGDPPIVITALVGKAKPIAVGTCSDGGFTSEQMSLPLSAAGTRVTVLLAGGTTKSQVRVSEFQWRGARR